ncbi:hypothetical protein J5226_15070 [Lysobacter sp. K5869]|nr:hypothetical protein J5226_15070 [Lysobacter sp. K5869]
MLKEYPDRLDALAATLRDAAAQPKGSPPFETAVSALEDALSSFISEARAERNAAEAGGDAQALQRADAKLDLMFKARSKNGGLADLNELWNHFDLKREAQA